MDRTHDHNRFESLREFERSCVAWRDLSRARCNDANVNDIQDPTQAQFCNPAALRRCRLYSLTRVSSACAVPMEASLPGGQIYQVSASSAVILAVNLSRYRGETAEKRERERATTRPMFDYRRSRARCWRRPPKVGERPPPGAHGLWEPPWGAAAEPRQCGRSRFAGTVFFQILNRNGQKRSATSASRRWEPRYFATGECGASC